MTNALATVANKPPADSWDNAGDELSPIRGPNIKFDNGEYFTGKEKTAVEPSREFVVVDRSEGWQFLKKDCQPEWVMRKPGEPKPEQPFVDEAEWPISEFTGKGEHPWKYALFIYLIATNNGETMTFSTSTAGGRIAIDEVTSQIRWMRNNQPGAVPIITLESRMMTTKFGRRPRPFFKIAGWKIRDEAGEAPKQITGDGTKEVNAFNDELPPF